MPPRSITAGTTRRRKRKARQKEYNPDGTGAAERDFGSPHRGDAMQVYDRFFVENGIWNRCSGAGAAAPITKGQRVEKGVRNPAHYKQAGSMP